MKTFGDVSPRFAHAEYSSFRITDENDRYRLIIGGYHGSCSDALLYHHNGSQFTTRDQDNDLNDDGNCAISSTGAWWYNKCLASNLNGQYLKGADSAYAKGIVWVHCWNHTYSLKETVMKIRRNE
jgi:ficolin